MAQDHAALVEALTGENPLVANLQRLLRGAAAAVAERDARIAELEADLETSQAKTAELQKTLVDRGEYVRHYERLANYEYELAQADAEIEALKSSDVQQVLSCKEEMIQSLGDDIEALEIEVGELKARDAQWEVAFAKACTGWGNVLHDCPPVRDGDQLFPDSPGAFCGGKLFVASVELCTQCYRAWADAPEPLAKEAETKP